MALIASDFMHNSNQKEQALLNNLENKVGRLLRSNTLVKKSMAELKCTSIVHLLAPSVDRRQRMVAFQDRADIDVRGFNGKGAMSALTLPNSLYDFSEVLLSRN